MAQAHELAQLNVALMKAPLDSPLMREFVANIDRINALADSAEGFIWRLGDTSEPAASMRPLGDTALTNMSVWKDVASLSNYVHKSAHAQVMRRKNEWFDRMKETYVVLWWIPAGHRPTIQEAIDRLGLLRRRGPSPDAFTFAKRFDPPGLEPSSAGVGPLQRSTGAVLS